MTLAELNIYIKTQNFSKALSVYKKRNPNKTKDDYIKYLYTIHGDFLRKCKSCGLEAHTEEDLDLFTKNKNTFYGRENTCRKCTNIKDSIRINSSIEKKQKSRMTKSKYAKSEKGLLKSRVGLQYRRAIKRQATPSWVDSIELNKIAGLHHQAKYLEDITGYKWDVDHIYPSVHPTMCGLHIFENLTLLPKQDNMLKNNRLGYIHQYNCSDLSKSISPRLERREVYNLLGSSMSWDDFIIYEKLNFGGYL